MKRSSFPLRTLAWPMLGFIYLPIFVIILYSFNSARHGFAWRGFTLDWYGTLWRDSLAWGSLRNSLWVALCSAAISTVLGTMLGLGLAKARSRVESLCSRGLFLSICIPDVIMAAGLLLFYATLRRWLGWFELGLNTVVWAHVTFELPFVALMVRSRAVSLDRRLEEAAADLGADRWQTFRHITLPLLRPAIFASFALAFTLSLDDFIVSFFTAGPGATTLPVLIYASVKRGLTPEIQALSTVIILLSAGGTILAAWLQDRPRSS